MTDMVIKQDRELNGDSSDPHGRGLFAFVPVMQADCRKVELLPRGRSTWSGALYQQIRIDIAVLRPRRAVGHEPGSGFRRRPNS